MVVVICPSSAYFLSNQIGSLSFRAILQICGMNVHNNIAHKIVELEFEIFIKNVVAVAAYIRHSLSQWPSRSREWTFFVVVFGQKSKLYSGFRDQPSLLQDGGIT